MSDWITYLLLVMVSVMAILLYRAEQRIEDIRQDLCAFVFYEDLSAGPRTDDDSRWECVYGRE